jgi:hypothetical protein
MDSGVEFVAVDNPHANKLTIHILAAVAEHEREAISERTKAALAAAKARGTKLGTPDPAGAVKRMPRATPRDPSAQVNANSLPTINRRAASASRFSASAGLNESKVTTATACRATISLFPCIYEARRLFRAARFRSGADLFTGWRAGSHLDHRPNARHELAVAMGSFWVSRASQDCLALLASPLRLWRAGGLRAGAHFSRTRF